MELTASDFANSVEARISDEIVAIALGSDYTIFATETTVWSRTNRHHYEAVAHIPTTAEEVGDELTHRQVALGSGNTWLSTRLTVVKPERRQEAGPDEYPDIRLLEIWDTSDCGEAIRLDTDFDLFSDVAFDPSDQFVAGLVSQSPFFFFNSFKLEEPPVRFFRARDGEKLNHAVGALRPGIEKTLSLSSNLDFAVTADDKAAFVRAVWDTKTFAVEYVSAFPRLISAALSPGAQFLVLVGSDKYRDEDPLKDIENRLSREHVRESHPATAILYRLEHDNYVKLVQWSLKDTPRQLAVSPDGGLTVIYFDDSVQIFSVSDNREITEAELGRGEKIESLTISPDGRFLAVIQKDNGKNVTVVRVWELARREEITVLSDATKSSPTLVFSPSGKHLLDVSSESVQLADLTTGRAKYIFPQVRVGSAAAFSPDETYLALSTKDGEVLVYKMTDLENEVTRFENLGKVAKIVFSHNNRYVATAEASLFAFPKPSEYPVRVFQLQAEDLIRDAEDRLSLFPKPTR